MGGRPPKRRPSFFKILVISDFYTLLRLPPHFWEVYGSDLPERVKLRVGSGGSWEVKVEQLEDGGGVFGFTHGWPQFAEEVGLTLGEFLVFSFDGKSIFDVSIYEKTACQRQIIAQARAGDHVVKRGRKRKQKEMMNSQPYFEIRLKNHHRSRISLGKWFCMAAGLKGKAEVGVEYGTTPSTVEVVQLVQRRYSTELGIGWTDFRKAHGMMLGRTYSFQFLPGKGVIRVNQITN